MTPPTRMHPLPGNELRRAACLANDSEAIEIGSEPNAERPIAELAHANLVTSRDTRYDHLDTEWAQNQHRPVLDLDFPAKLIPSSTADHHHLYIDKPMLWADYVKLITVMAEVGLLQQGYVKASIARGYTAARLPGIYKRDAQGRLHRHPQREAANSEAHLVPWPCHCLHDDPEVDPDTAEWDEAAAEAFRTHQRSAWPGVYAF